MEFEIAAEERCFLEALITGVAITKRKVSGQRAEASRIFGGRNVRSWAEKEGAAGGAISGRLVSALHVRA